MPDIVITPNRGTSTNPKIDFTGVTTGTIKLEVLTDGSLSFNGANGSLFNIADSVTGSLMSVNDTSGLPILEVFDTDKVVMGKYAQNTLVVDGTRIGIGTTDFSYTTSDNTPIIGSNTNNKLFVNGSIQLLSNDNALVIGRGAATFLKDEELGFGWGGGWYMDDATYIRARNSKAVYSGNTIYSGSDLRAPAFYFSDDTNSRWVNGYQLFLRGASPTIYFRDTDHNSAMIHVNSNIFYVLRGATDTESWTTYDSRWPLEINLSNNRASFGGQVSATSSAAGSLFIGTKAGAGYSDGVDGATFKSITDHPTGGSYAFAAYYNGSSGTNSFYVTAAGAGYFKSTLNTDGKVYLNASGGWNDAQGLLTVGGTGDGRIQVRHIWGKEAGTANADNLWLQYTNTGKHVQIGSSGGGNNLYVSGDLYQGGYFSGNLVLHAGNYSSYALPLSGGTVSGNITISGTYKRSSAGIGYLDGNYSSVETTGTTGPIYCISTTYAPTSTALGSMYGIGYNYGNAGVGFSNTWGMYVAANGYVGHFLAEGGIGYAVSSYRAPIFYDKDNTNYYVDPAGTSVLGSTYISSHLYTSVNSVNPEIRTSGAGAAGLVIRDSNSAFRVQLYGDGTYYGFLGSTWGSWDIQKQIGGNLYLNNNTTYYLNTTAGSNLNGTLINNGGTAMTGGWNRNLYLVSTFPVIVFNSSNTKYSGIGVDYSTSVGGMYFWTNGSSSDISGTGTAAMSINTGNYVQAYGSFRAPLFYDSDNTGYYVDPNGTTNINTVYTADVYSSQWFRNSNSGYGLYNQSTTNHFYSDDASYYNIAPNTSTASGLRLRTEGYGGTVRGYFYANNSNDVGILRYDGSWRMRIVGGDYAVFDGSSARAQIFYDYNDTGYYVNPNGTSQLNYVLANDWFRPQGSTGIYFQDYGYGLRSAHGEGNNYGNAATYGVGRNGWSGWGLASRFCLMTDVNNGGNTLGMHDNSYSWIWRWIPDQYFTVDRGYSIFANSARAPIFYDSNNTGYYVDPDSTSVLNNLQIVDGNVHLYKTQIVDMSNTSTYSTSNYYPVIFACPVNGIYVQIQNNLNTNVPSWATHGGGFTLNLRWWTNGSGWGTTSVKRVIEQYHEGYANQTICGGITQMTNGSVEVVWLRGGGQYRFIFSRDVSASAQSGTYTNNGQSVTAQSSAVNNIWDANSGYHKSYANVFIDSDNNGYYVDPSSTSVLYQLNTNYNIYPQNYGLGLVGVYSSTRYQAVFSMGDSYKLPADGTTTGNLYGLAWSHPNAGGVAGNLNTHGLLAMENGTWLASVSGSIRCRDDMRSPVFYDSNDTNYFVNPNGNSSVTLNFDVTGAIGATDDVRSGLRMYDTTAMAANVGGQIVLGYKYTAGGNLTEGAIIKMYKENATDGHYGSGLKFQVRNTGEGLGTRVWIDPTGNLISDQSVRGPIFYDTDNTYYYSDPGSNSRIYNLQVGNTISDEYGNGIIRLFGNLHIDAYNGYDIYANYYSGRRFRTFYSSNTESFRTDTDGIVYAYSQFRTPLMYDYNNTGYYVDPASTSVTSVVKANYFCGLDSNAYGQYKGYDNNNHFITIRGAVSGTTTTPTITGAHQTTLVEYAEVNDSTGWFFKTAGTGNYDIVSRITRSYSSFEGSARSPVFYDSNDTNYFLDPASTSYLWRPDAATQQRWNIHYRAMDAGAARPSITGDSNYWTTTVGWGTNYGTWSNYWKYGFGGFDCWGTNTDHPQGSGYVHAQGIQSGLHYATSNASDAYGWQMVGADSTGPRWWLRKKWGSTTYNWYEIATYGNNVGGAFYASIFYDADDTNYYLNPNGNCRVNTVYANSLGVGTAATGTGGEIVATNNITAYYSDERLKTKLGPIENPIEKIKSLSGFYFEANETAVALGYDKKREVGVSAQEVQAILPEIVVPAPISDEYLTVRYEKLIPLLIEAIKEQQTQIESLRNELAQLKSNK